MTDVANWCRSKDAIAHLFPVVFTFPSQTPFSFPEERKPSLSLSSAHTPPPASLIAPGEPLNGSLLILLEFQTGSGAVFTGSCHHFGRTYLNRRFTFMKETSTRMGKAESMSGFVSRLCPGFSMTQKVHLPMVPLFDSDLTLFQLVVLTLTLIQRP